jgi:hypothetical protein
MPPAVAPPRVPMEPSVTGVAVAVLVWLTVMAVILVLV